MASPTRYTRQADNGSDQSANNYRLVMHFKSNRTTDWWLAFSFYSTRSLNIICRAYFKTPSKTFFTHAINVGACCSLRVGETCTLSSSTRPTRAQDNELINVGQWASYATQYTNVFTWTCYQCRVFFFILHLKRAQLLLFEQQPVNIFYFPLYIISRASPVCAHPEVRHCFQLKAGPCSPFIYCPIRNCLTGR